MWIVRYWLQPLEALLYTLDQVNRDAALLPGVRLGVIVLDTCDNPLYTAEQSLDLLQGFMYRQAVGICSYRRSCCRLSH